MNLTHATRPRGRLIIWLGFALLLGLNARSASGHNLEQGYVYLDLNQATLHGRVELTVADLNRALALALPEDGSVEESDLVMHGEAITGYLAARVGLAPNGIATRLEYSACLLYTSPSPRDKRQSRMPSSA